MKRRALHWDPHRKMFTDKSETIVLRLLDPEEEELAREYLANPPVDDTEEEFLLYMSEAAIFKNW